MWQLRPCGRGAAWAPARSTVVVTGVSLRAVAPRPSPAAGAGLSPALSVRSSTATSVGPSDPPPSSQEASSGASCRACGGARVVPCGRCRGLGLLPLGGYNRNNPVPPLSKLRGTKWTARQETLGWRHFTASDTRRAGSQGHGFVELTATCDPLAKIWLNAALLKDRQRWAGGWLQKSELLETEEGGRPCAECGRKGRVACPICCDAGPGRGGVFHF